MFTENIFSLDEALQQNTLITGANRSGKTRLACAIASDLHKLGYQTIVFDTCATWLRASDLPYFVRARYSQYGYIEIPETPASSYIMDLSRLKLKDTKQVVDRICLEIWNNRIDKLYNKPMFLIFEESECYLKNIRSIEKFGNIYRMLHVGRNISVRALLITTDLSLLDCSAIRLTNQRFHGYLNPEVNSKRRFNAYYGKDYTTIALEGLQTGDFIRYQKRKLKILHVPLFQPMQNPIQYHKPIEAKQPSLIQRIKQALHQ